MKIYAISGLGADRRVFQYLKLDFELVPIDWITPKHDEPLTSYAKRLSKSISTEEEYIVLGVSFGGLVAVEVSKLLSPSLTVLVSSVEDYRELRSIYRLAGQLKLIRWIPKPLFNPPRSIACWLFGTDRKALLNDILNETDLNFAKWAVSALVSWKNTERVRPILKISGSHDKLIPSANDKNTEVISGGEHFMVVDRASEISQIINEKIARLHLNVN